MGLWQAVLTLGYWSAVKLRLAQKQTGILCGFSWRCHSSYQNCIQAISFSQFIVQWNFVQIARKQGKGFCNQALNILFEQAQPSVRNATKRSANHECQIVVYITMNIHIFTRGYDTTESVMQRSLFGEVSKSRGLSHRKVHATFHLRQP